MKARNNPFTADDVQCNETFSMPSIMPWKWDLTGVVREGSWLSFQKCSSRPKLFGPLMSALWSGEVINSPGKHFEVVRQKRDSLHRLVRYLDEIKTDWNPKETSVKDLSRETLIDFRKWLHSNYGNTTAGRSYLCIAKLMKILQGEDSPVSGSVPSELEIPSKSLRRSDATICAVQPYTHDEQVRLIDAAKKEISDVLGRLALGKALLAEGQDPRLVGHLKQPWNKKSIFTTGWNSKANDLWYLVHVLKGQFPSRSSAQNCLLTRYLRNRWADSDNCTFNTPSELISHLYPSYKDLVPFMILLSIKSGLNAESLLTLTRDCLHGEEAGKTIVEFKKHRGSHEQMKISFSNRGSTSPIALIKLVLKMTESLVPFASDDIKNQLWLAHRKAGPGWPYLGQAAALTYDATMYFSNGLIQGPLIFIGFMEAHDLRDRNGDFLKFGFRQTRKTVATNAYLKSGNLANVSKKTLKHHGKQALNTTAFHYLTNDATHHIHNQTIRIAQDKVVQEARGIVVIKNVETEGEIAALARQLSESEEKIVSILSGEQDVFIASCRDFYNKPGGIPETPCSDPWQCFSCENALWTSRILPRLVKFKLFMEQQRKLLTPIDWSNKFDLPYSAITKSILPRFPSRTLEWANIQAEETPFYVSPHLREA
ncbi:hypothetical protein [Herminiimonas fonticola]|uniref:Core-binding (CB) domain-containing protein n=1 Tax=Herminiimonas fonticola TaxID=303380 RepID=A0A4R6G571_9BURK|nr:hypothetical protein [Herminiimonas fonticola]RBA22917.1 hypothetical protein Hfont_2720 [Herminiimonas fonticola]TDN89639.1 hypothetical protein EV677_1699 [Herminiimonas fonticola]